MPLGSDETSDGDPAPPCKRGTPAPPPIFGPCLLWPNGCMDQDKTWHVGRPRPWPHCVRWGPSSPSPKGGRDPEFSAHVCCGQTSVWIKMPLGTKVGLCPCHIVLNRDPAPPSKRGTEPPPIFGHVYCGHGRPS